MYNLTLSFGYENCQSPAITVNRVRTGFGKLRILIIQFSMTWKVLEKERFFKMALERFGFLFEAILKYPEMDKFHFSFY